MWGESGELVCTRPFPSQPTHFWMDESGSKYHKAYFSKFPGRRGRQGGARGLGRALGLPSPQRSPERPLAACPPAGCWRALGGTSSGFSFILTTVRAQSPLAWWWQEPGCAWEAGGPLAYSGASLPAGRGRP